MADVHPTQAPRPSQNMLSPVPQATFVAVRLTPQTPATQVRVWHPLSTPGHSAAL
jgi:hypothetical protein